MGILTSIDTKGKIAHVVFDDERIACHEFEQLNDLVVMPLQFIKAKVANLTILYCLVLHLSHSDEVNLLYTAITRAKKMVV